jgi:hypothetical protein
MGARVNYVFDDGSDALVVLYSHWGADSIESDLADAFAHAQPRQGDYSYWTRMVISYLIQNEVLAETGYGIYATTRSEMSNVGWLEQTVVIDCKTATYDYDGVYA